MRQTISSTGRGIVGCEDQSVSKEKKSRNVTRLGKKKPCYNSVNFFQDIILFTSGVHRGGVLVLNIGPSRRGLKKYEVSIKYWTRCRAHISCPPPPAIASCMGHWVGPAHDAFQRAQMAQAGAKNICLSRVSASCNSGPSLPPVGRFLMSSNVPASEPGLTPTSLLLLSFQNFMLMDGIVVILSSFA